MTGYDISVPTYSASAQNDVATPIAEQRKMVEDAHAIRTLMGGTRAMRHARERYLPREEAEDMKAYQNRVDRTFLFNAVAKVVGDLTGKVFAKEVLLSDDVPPVIEEYAENIDLTGRHLNVFARDVFEDALQTGIGYILVDMPPPVPQGSTLAQEQAANIRPFLNYIPMERLIGWQSQILNGVPTLTQIRILECVTVPDGEFQEKEIEQIRVITPGEWRTFRRTETANGPNIQQGDWIADADGTYSLQKIPLVPVVLNRKDFMTATPPLARLAELNIAHWQSSSDQRNILHCARVPILFFAGKKDSDRFVVGANTIAFSSDPNAKLQYVEHTGAAINSGKDDLESLETQMQAFGLLMTVGGPGKTATGEVAQNVKENAPLAMMARALGDALENALGYMAEYMGIPEGGGSVTVNTDYGMQSGMTTDLQWLNQAVIAGKLSEQTYWAELQRRGTLRGDFDPEEEKELLDAQNANALIEAQNQMKGVADNPPNDKQGNGNGSNDDGQ